MLVAFEGIDGSGKGTNAKGLAENLVDQGLKVGSFAFPRYETSRYGKLVGQYLNGDFGDSVHPQLACLTYALDRLSAKRELDASLIANDVTICDRYVPSNIAHQCARLGLDENGHALAQFIMEMEHGDFKLPVPDLVICLTLPVEDAVKHVSKKAKRAYTDKEADLHEADSLHLLNTQGWYRKLPTFYRAKKWVEIDLDRNGHIKTVDTVFAEVLEAFQRQYPNG